MWGRAFAIPRSVRRHLAHNRDKSFSRGRGQAAPLPINKHLALVPNACGREAAVSAPFLVQVAKEIILGRTRALVVAGAGLPFFGAATLAAFLLSRHSVGGLGRRPCRSERERERHGNPVLHRGCLRIRFLVGIGRRSQRPCW